MALTTRFIQQEIECQPPRCARSEIDGAFLFDRAQRSVVMKALVEVVDHPQLLQRPAGTVDQFHLECHPIAHLRRQWPGDQHGDGILSPGDRGEQSDECHHNGRQCTTEWRYDNGSGG